MLLELLHVARRRLPAPALERAMKRAGLGEAQSISRFLDGDPGLAQFALRDPQPRFVEHLGQRRALGAETAAQRANVEAELLRHAPDLDGLNVLLEAEQTTHALGDAVGLALPEQDLRAAGQHIAHRV